MVGDEDEVGVVYMTVDSGDTWSSVSISGGAPSVFWDVVTWGDGTDAVAVGNGGKFYERENSSNFVLEGIDLDPGAGTDVPTNHLYDVEVFGSAPDVVVVGSAGRVLFRESNAWTSPKSQTSDELTRASFQSTSHGFILGKMFLICEYE